MWFIQHNGYLWKWVLNAKTPIADLSLWMVLLYSEETEGIFPWPAGLKGLSLSCKMHMMAWPVKAGCVMSLFSPKMSFSSLTSSSLWTNSWYLPIQQGLASMQNSYCLQWSYIQGNDDRVCPEQSQALKHICCILSLTVEIPPGEFSKVRVSVLGIQSSARITGKWGGGGGKVGKTEKRKEKREEKRGKTKNP